MLPMSPQPAQRPEPCAGGRVGRCQHRWTPLGYRLPEPIEAQFADGCIAALLQGETDAGINDAPETYLYYQRLLAALLVAWRKQFRQPSLAFDIVQLAAFKSPYARLDEPKRRDMGHWPVVREAQRQV